MYMFKLVLIMFGMTWSQLETQSIQNLMLTMFGMTQSLLVHIVC